MDVRLARAFALWLTACLLWLGGVSVVRAQDFTALTLMPDRPPTTENGVVSVEFLVRQPNGLGVTELAPTNIQLDETVTELRVSAEQRLPLNLAVVVDLSIGSDVPLIQQTLRAYIQGYYREGDTLTFYVLDTDTFNPRVVPAESREQATQVIDSIGRAGRFYLLPQALNAALNSLVASADALSRPRHVLYVGSFLTAPRDAALSLPFRQNGIPFHVVQAHGGTRSPDALLSMARQGGGLYANNINGELVLADGTAVNALKVLYDTLSASRNVFTLRYVPQNPSLESTRDVTMTVTLSDVQAQTRFAYNWQFQPLEVFFLEGAALSPQRRTFRPDGGERLSFDLNEQLLALQVRFPDGVRRRIASARLEVVEVESGQVQQSTLELNPQLTARDTLTLRWSLESFTAPGTRTPVAITVTIVDELGLSASATLDGLVSVSPAPTVIPPTPAPTQEPLVVTATAAALLGLNNPSVAVIAVDVQGTPIFVDGQPLVVSNPDRLISSPTFTLLIALIALLTLLVVLAVARLLRIQRVMRERQKQEAALAPTPAQPAVPKAKAPVETPKPVINNNVAKPYVYEEEPNYDTRHEVEQAEASAEGGLQDDGVFMRLIVRKGFEQIETLPNPLIEVRSREYVIGRAPTSAWQISLPIISPEHARLTMHENGDLTVRDLGSKNGTYINGERCATGQEVRVPSGSEVWITRDIIIEVYDARTQIDYDDPILGISQRRRVVEAEEVMFKTLPGLVVSSEDYGQPIDDDYSPI